MPFIEKEIGKGDDVILIGHSSGAVAILRYLESHKIKLAIVIGASHTDLGDETEKLSGYFNRPWKWEVIKKNAEKIVQFASTDDPYIPIEEARFIHKNLDSEYHEFNDQGHFGSDTNKKEFPEIIDIISRYTESKK